MKKMKHIKNKNITAIIISIFTIIMINLSGCLQQDLQLDNVEIREYQGEKLSSVYDFMENSITVYENESNISNIKIE